MLISGIFDDENPYLKFGKRSTRRNWWFKRGLSKNMKAEQQELLRGLNEKPCSLFDLVCLWKAPHHIKQEIDMEVYYTLSEGMEGVI